MRQKAASASPSITVRAKVLGNGFEGREVHSLIHLVCRSPWGLLILRLQDHWGGEGAGVRYKCLLGGYSAQVADNPAFPLPSRILGKNIFSLFRTEVFCAGEGGAGFACRAGCKGQMLRELSLGGQLRAVWASRIACAMAARQMALASRRVRRRQAADDFGACFFFMGTLLAWFLCQAHRSLADFIVSEGKEGESGGTRPLISFADVLIVRSFSEESTVPRTRRDTVDSSLKCFLVMSGLLP